MKGKEKGYPKRIILTFVILDFSSLSSIWQFPPPPPPHPPTRAFCTMFCTNARNRTRLFKRWIELSNG